MSRYILRENMNISAMLLIYGVFIFVGSSFLPPYILPIMCIIPVSILMVGAVLINNPKGIPRLKTYLRLQISVNGIFSIYNILLIDRSLTFLFSSHKERFWHDNITFMTFVIICELANLGILMVSVYNIRKMIHHYLSFVRDVGGVAAAANDPIPVAVVDSQYPDKGENMESPPEFSKTKVPPEWSSLYPDTAHNV